MTGNLKAVLIIADISGYTQFMKLHAISMSHARQIIVRLLKVLVKTVQSPLRVAELEGDAVFLYAPCTARDLATVTGRVKTQLLDLLHRFNEEVALLSRMNVCQCDACARVGGLRLKQVVHVGEVAVEKIARFQKLFGLDVILVHRMLKNSVPSREYVMMTETAYQSFTDFHGLSPERRVEQFEGVGQVPTLVFYPGHLLEAAAPAAATAGQVAPLRRLTWMLQLLLRTLLEVSGLSRRKPAFGSLPT